VISKELPSAGVGVHVCVGVDVAGAGHLDRPDDDHLLHGRGDAAEPIFFGLFFNDLLKLPWLQAHTTNFTGRSRCDRELFVVFITFRGINVSTRSSVRSSASRSRGDRPSATIIVEKIVNGGLPSRRSTRPHSTGGFNVFWTAIILGILSFTGFDVISTVSEEAKAPAICCQGDPARLRRCRCLLGPEPPGPSPYRAGSEVQKLTASASSPRQVPSPSSTGDGARSSSSSPRDERGHRCLHRDRGGILPVVLLDGPGKSAGRPARELNPKYRVPWNA